MPYVVSTFRGNLHRRLREFHTQYSPIVRIAPNDLWELSYVDTSVDDIYSTQKGSRLFERNRTWFPKQSEKEAKSIMTFARKSLESQASIVEGYADLLVEQLKSLAKGKNTSCTAYLSQWFNFFAFDVADDLSLANGLTA